MAKGHRDLATILTDIVTGLEEALEHPDLPPTRINDIQESLDEMEILRDDIDTTP